MKITDTAKVVEVIGRLQGRANSYENAGNQTKNEGKRDVCLRAAAEMRDWASMLASAFDEPERAVLHDEYVRAAV